MEPPVEPAKEDCCNSGCNPCIFDVYHKQLKLYEKCKNEGDNSCNLIDNGISQLEYTKFYVSDIQQICDIQKILYFQKIKGNTSRQVWWKPGDHFLIKYTSIDNVCCTRAYTPIKLHSKDSNSCDFLVVVKKYTNGLISNYLFSLMVGEETLWRGPYGSYNVQPNKYNKIIMIAQGTGVAPFVSIIQHILSNEEDMTKIYLFYCCKDTVEILFRDEIYAFSSYWNFSYKIFLNSRVSESPFDQKYNEPIVFNRFNIKELDNLKLHPDDLYQYLLCGSEQFMKEYEANLKNRNQSDDIFLF